MRTQRSTVRRALSPEIVKAPRFVYRTAQVQASRVAYARTRMMERSPERALQRAVDGDVGEALAALGAASGARFFRGGEASVETAAFLRATVPGWCERTISDADRICDHVVRLLGWDDVDLAKYGRQHDLPRSSLPWHHDVINGHQWSPRTFYRRVPIPPEGADIKVPWELSRAQHLPTLAMAYAASGDERYAGEVVAQIADWIAQNPPGLGVNWASSMDAGIRAVNWLWAYFLLGDAGQLTPEFRRDLLASLYAHARHIEANISIYEGGVTTNHTVSEYAALAYLGLLLPQLRDAARWRSGGLRGLATCMRTHVGADGVDYENSLAYHRLVAEMYLGVLILAERNGHDLPADYCASLERMLEFTLHYTKPNGLAPLVGDSDDGRWHLLANYSSWSSADHRHLLAVGSVVFGRADFAACARDAAGAVEEVAWLLGSESAEHFIRLQPKANSRLRSRMFPQGGRVVMRFRDHHALVSVDEVGTDGYGNHKHNDILSYELSVAGEPLVVDCGSYLYLADRQARDAFRGTRAHNTLIVDGVEQNRAPDPFRMDREAVVAIRRWHVDDDADVLIASHTGYDRLEDPVVHVRSFVFRKAPFGWLVVDRLECAHSHEVEGYVHLAGGAAVGAAEMAGGDVEDALDDLGRRLGPDLCPSCDVRPVSVSVGGLRAVVAPLGWREVTVEPGWVAPRFGRREPAPVLRMSGCLGPGSVVGHVVIATD